MRPFPIAGAALAAALLAGCGNNQPATPTPAVDTVTAAWACPAYDKAMIPLLRGLQKARQSGEISLYDLADVKRQILTTSAGLHQLAKKTTGPFSAGVLGTAYAVDGLLDAIDTGRERGNVDLRPAILDTYGSTEIVRGACGEAGTPLRLPR